MVVINKKYVIDASVGLKWLINEKNCMVQALKMKEHYVEKKIKLMVPSHFYNEICNTIGRNIPKDALNFYSIIKLYSLHDYEINFRIAEIAFRLMKQYPKISFYDAAYHALAISENATFVTADENYYKTAKGSGSIMLLKNYC